MLLNYIKEFSAKKKLRNSLHDVKRSPILGTVTTIGLIVDEQNFAKKEELISELKANGILEKNIEVLIYKERSNTSLKEGRTILNFKDLNWNAEIKNKAVSDFIDKEFDLLISYYDVEKTILMTVTHHSKAHFKVGFSSVDKRLNDLMINTNVENYEVFIQELFRYLKILNKQ
jgi:hypothetical protein